LDAVFYCVMVLMIVRLGTERYGHAAAKRVALEWADWVGFDVVKARRTLVGGAFVMELGPSHRVFRLTVVTPEGPTADIDVRCGHWLTGMFWDESMPVARWVTSGLPVTRPARP
jgi:hypothetical protein